MRRQTEHRYTLIVLPPQRPIINLTIDLFEMATTSKKVPHVFGTAKFNCFVFITGILARVTEGDKSDMQKLGYEYIRLVIKDLCIHY